MLATSDPVRNRPWWLRTAVYWFTLVAQQVADPAPTLPLVAVTAAMLVPAAAVFVRDRHPWLLAISCLLLGATVAETPLALGVAAVASRSRTPWTLAYSAAAIGALALPSPRLLTSGLSVTGTGVTAAMALGIAVLILVVLPALIGTLSRTSRAAARQRADFQRQQRESAAEQAVIAERNRIAQEMHDVLGHKLSLISLQAGALEVNADAAPEVIGRQAELIRTTSGQAMTELRQILGILGDEEPAALHPRPGLAEALDLVEQNRASGLQVEVDNQLDPDLVLPVATGAAVHRVIQEGLTNAHRHAAGAPVRLTLSTPDAGRLRLELVNPTAGPANPGSGRGLPGLRERVRALGSTLDAAPTPDGGFRLVAELPINNQEVQQ